ncbi:hypothetical protein GZL_04545 [Streptomyces sp. 769]|nr:hypothetical protein GZL_04545 [Streptomyces sp. 769]
MPHATGWMPQWTGPETGQPAHSDALDTVTYGPNAPVHTL